MAVWARGEVSVRPRQFTDSYVGSTTVLPLRGGRTDRSTFDAESRKANTRARACARRKATFDRGVGLEPSDERDTPGPPPSAFRPGGAPLTSIPFTLLPRYSKGARTLGEEEGRSSVRGPDGRFVRKSHGAVWNVRGGVRVTIRGYTRTYERWCESTDRDACVCVRDLTS